MRKKNQSYILILSFYKKRSYENMKSNDEYSLELQINGIYLPAMPVMRDLISQTAKGRHVQMQNKKSPIWIGHF